MIINRYFSAVIYSVVLFSVAVSQVNAETIKAYELLYDEQESGTDIYRVRFLITDHYLRIDDLDEESGYIIFDYQANKISSLSHQDKSILVIPAISYIKPEMKGQVEESLVEMTAAPKISGKPVFNYKLISKADNKVCSDIHLAAGLLPEVTKVLKAYQIMIAGQQSKTLANTPEEFQTTCFIYDQVYNDGPYYDKGLPIQEWHSNGKKRQLTSYKEIDVDSSIFELQKGYKEYSIK